MVPFNKLFQEPVRNGVYKPKKFHGRGVKIINMGEIFAFDFISRQEMKRLELSDQEMEKNLVKHNDLLFARRSLVLEGSGKCSIIANPPEPTTYESSIIRVRLNHSYAAPLFYYYFFKAPQGRAAMASIATRTAVSGITGSNLALLQVPHPPIQNQQKIAAVLSAYDELIGNNLRRIKLLEEMAQTLYREWFVKFRFPACAEASAGRPSYEKVKLVDSPLGKIPEGWEVSTVSDNITVVPRKNKIQTGDYLTEGVIPVIDQGKDFIAGYIDDTSLAYYGPLPIIVFGDHTCVLKWVDFPFAVGADGTQLIQPEYPEKLPPRLLFYTLQFVPLEQFGYQRHFKYLKEAKILIPPANLAHKFEEVVSPNTDLILKLQRQNLNLRQIRDLLLPKLISGELDVRDLDVKTPEPE
jgi:type I restriction enzyme, S subunit